MEFILSLSCHSERSEESRGSKTTRELIQDSSPAGSE